MANLQRSVLVLHEALPANARADEKDALVQVAHVSDALRSLGWSVSVLATDLNLRVTLAAIAERKPACVFNLVESLNGDGRLVHLAPSLLQSADLRFTGADGDAMFLTSQKLLAKQWMRQHDVPTPLSFSLGEIPVADASTWIVKSVWEHASFGLDDGCVVAGLSGAQERLRKSKALHGGEWFAEEFVDGREFNVSVIERDGKAEVLPIAEMVFTDYPHGKPRIVGYAAKWDEAAPEYHATQRCFPALPVAEHAAIIDMVNKCWRIFGLRGYARVDIRMDAAGVPWVLEVNANPCLSPDAGFAAAASEAGIDYAQMIEQIVCAAMD
jgi:D-alanine-D-alanine ligase